MNETERDTLTAILSLYHSGQITVDSADYLCEELFEQSDLRSKINELFPQNVGA